DAVRQLDPTIVDLIRHAERLGGLTGPAERARDQLVDRPDMGGDRPRLLQADLVERLVDAALQPPGGVQRGATVADEDEHGDRLGNRPPLTRTAGLWPTRGAAWPRRTTSPDA